MLGDVQHVFNFLLTPLAALAPQTYLSNDVAYECFSETFSKVTSFLAHFSDVSQLFLSNFWGHHFRTM